MDRIKDVDIIINNKVKLNKSNLQYAKKLKLICLTATGTNNIDFSCTKQLGIKVCNIVGYSTESVAQHTFCVTFLFVRKTCLL